MDVEEIKQAREKVLEILKINEKARNSDNYLILSIWSEQINHHQIFTEDSYRFMNASSIIRERAKIQNEEGKFLPSPEVAIRRKIKEEVMKKYYGEHSTEFQTYLNIKYNIK